MEASVTTMYRIADWDERYEVDTKGREWKIGQPKWAGKLRFTRLKINGTALGMGYRKLQAAAGKKNALQVFGLFCKLLEIAGNSTRDTRNRIPEVDELAFAIDAPVSQVEFSIKVLKKVGWVEELSESSESFHQGGVTEPNLTEPNLTKPNQTQQNEVNTWELLRSTVGNQFGSDRGVEGLMQWLGRTLAGGDRETIDQTCSSLMDMLKTAKTKRKPAAWWMTVASKHVGYGS